MMDVLLVAIVIFATKTSGLAQAFTQPGLWFYAGSSLAVALLSGLGPKGMAHKNMKPAGGPCRFRMGSFLKFCSCRMCRHQMDQWRYC